MSKLKQKIKSLPDMWLLTPGQRKFLESLWFVWGNNGPKHSVANHKYIQSFLEQGEDCSKFYKPHPDLRRVVNSILAAEVRLQSWSPCEKCGTNTFNAVKVVDRWVAWCGCP